jgi:monothiol glutaredoxin
MTPELKSRLDELVQTNKVMVFMKGSKLMPQCGFSNNAVQILNSLGVPYETFDVLSDSDVRQGIKEYSNWPTIPQVYINGEFIGGSDVLIELYQQGELQQMLEVALAS